MATAVLAICILVLKVATYVLSFLQEKIQQKQIYTLLLNYLNSDASSVSYATGMPYEEHVKIPLDGQSHLGPCQGIAERCIAFLTVSTVTCTRLTKTGTHMLDIRPIPIVCKRDVSLVYMTLLMSSSYLGRPVLLRMIFAAETSIVVHNC